MIGLGIGRPQAGLIYNPVKAFGKPNWLQYSTALASGVIATPQIIDPPDLQFTHLIFDAANSIFPTAYADVRASSATNFNSSGILSTVASNTPRYDYNPTTLAFRGLLVEDTATNLALGSNDFSDASQTFDGTSRTASATTSPDGTTNAIKLVESATTAEHRTYQHISGTVTGTSFMGVFAKAAERSWVRLVNTNSPVCNFNLAQGQSAQPTIPFPDL
jgi:hypothetical protein